MRVLSQAEIDAMLANMLANPSILPETALKSENKSPDDKKETEKADT